MTSLLTLYFLDSGSYSSGYLDWLGYFFPTEYDWIHEVGVPLYHYVNHAHIFQGPNQLVFARIFQDPVYRASVHTGHR